MPTAQPFTLEIKSLNPKFGRENKPKKLSPQISATTTGAPEEETQQNPTSSFSMETVELHSLARSSITGNSSSQLQLLLIQRALRIASNITIQPKLRCADTSKKQTKKKPCFRGRPSATPRARPRNENVQGANREKERDQKMGFI